VIRAENLVAEVSKFFMKVTSLVVEKGSHVVFYTRIHRKWLRVLLRTYAAIDRWLDLAPAACV